MCTVSWAGGPDGYDLFFNRDELNARAPEAPPTATQQDGVKFLAPRDGDHGGTWLLVNEYGLTVCVLNDYAAAWQPAPGATRYSRGQVVLACAVATDHAGVIDVLKGQPLLRAPAFHLVVMAPEQGPLVLHWTGTLPVAPVRSACGPPLTSSSFATHDVIAQRTARFAAMVRSPRTPALEDLAAYHQQHEQDHGAASVLMRRPDAATRSICRVSVRGGNVVLRYQPVDWARPQPDRLDPIQLELPLRRSMPSPA